LCRWATSRSSAANRERTRTGRAASDPIGCRERVEVQTEDVLTNLREAAVTANILGRAGPAGASAFRLPPPIPQKDRRGDAEPSEMAGLYWHFVDTVWVFIFPTLYLLRHA
jgi:hypothetical protein